jgi:hypothetical protein
MTPFEIAEVKLPNGRYRNGIGGRGTAGNSGSASVSAAVGGNGAACRGA